MFSTFSTHAPWRKWKQTLENNMKEHVWYAVTTDNFFFIRSLLNLQHETKKQKSVKVALLCKQRKSHWDGIQETQCKPKEETVTSVSTPTAHLDECGQKVWPFLSDWGNFDISFVSLSSFFFHLACLHHLIHVHTIQNKCYLWLRSSTLSKKATFLLEGIFLFSRCLLSTVQPKP